MDPNIARQASNSKVLTALVKQLTSPMSFLVIISLIILFGAKWWTSDLNSPVSQMIAFWLWFVVTLCIMVVGTILLWMDSKIAAQGSEN